MERRQYSKLARSADLPANLTDRQRNVDVPVNLADGHHNADEPQNSADGHHISVSNIFVRLYYEMPV